MKHPLHLAVAVFVLLGSARAEWTLDSHGVLAEPARGLEVVESVVSDASGPVTLTAVVFSERAFTLRVIDSPQPGASKASSVLSASGAVAGVNGGYFHDDYRAVGLVVADGRQLHAFEKAKLLSGVLTVRPNKIDIVRAGQFETGKDLRDAIQCGPMLLEDGEPVAGLNNERRARRTVVATDGRGRWALIYLTSCTLAGSARILQIPGILGDWTPRTALNLDGGSSSGLWASAVPAPIARPEFGNVRNYLGVFPR